MALTDQQILRVIEALERLPTSLSHCDCHPKNLFPELRSGKHVATVAFDWASVGFAPLGRDAGPLLGSGLVWTEISPDRASRLERRVFDSYVAGLDDAGWRGDREAVRLAYLSGLAVDYGGRTLKFIVRMASDPALRSRLEHIVGKPLADILSSWEEYLRFSLPLIDEAASIAEKLER